MTRLDMRSWTQGAARVAPSLWLALVGACGGMDGTQPNLVGVNVGAPANTSDYAAARILRA